MLNDKKITAIIPAFNESIGIKQVIDGLFCVHSGINEKLIDDIIVCDNGSTDDTAAIAHQSGARVIFVKKKGYGSACLEGINAIIRTDIVLFIDGDNTFHPNQSLALCECIDNGADLAIGCRPSYLKRPDNLKRRHFFSELMGYFFQWITSGFKNKVAMPWYQYFGNRFLCWLTGLLFQVNVKDIGPYRAIDFLKLRDLNMSDLSYGWTIEMQIKALKSHYKIIEIDVSLSARKGRSKISGNPLKAFYVGSYMVKVILKLRFRP